MHPLRPALLLLLLKLSRALRCSSRRGLCGGAAAAITLSPRPSVAAPAEDPLYPASLLGRWRCARTIASVEGDVGQARTAWRALGGGDAAAFAERRPEAPFESRFVAAPGRTYPFEGATYEGVVLDRAAERASRGGAGPEPAAVARTFDLQPEGFGFDETDRWTDGVERALRVRRKYRRAFDKAGNREIEGLEIVQTFRVLDGVAGDLPTSTTKSTLRLARPTS